MFDVRRFLRLAQVHWAERGREYLWFLGIGIVVHGCVWLLITQGGTEAQRYQHDEQVMVYVCGFILTSLLFAGLHFSALSRRGSALTWLMRPASTLEKFLLAFLIVAVLYPLAYTLAFEVCNLPGAWLGHAVAQLDAANPLRHRDYGPYLPFADADMRLVEASIFLVMNALQALVVAGMLRFRNLAWLKTLVAGFVLLAVVIPLLSMLSGGDVELLFPGEIPPADRTLFRFWRWALWIGVPGLFWASAYFYLRDRELH